MSAWSFSSLDLFETCPKKYYHLRVVKDVTEPPWEHRQEGEDAHRALRNRLYRGSPLPTGLAKLEGVCAQLDAAPGEIYLEHKIALDKNLNVVDWFDKRVWVRAIFDVAKVNRNKGVVLDWKMGKKHEESDQLELFAAVLMAWQPQVDEVSTGYVWAKDDVITNSSLTTETFTRERDFSRLWGEFNKRAARIDKAFDTGVWQPKQSGLCRRHCPVSTCVYHGE